MNCHELQQHLAEYLGNELAPALRADVDAHLESCTACHAEVAALSATLGELGHLTTVSAAEAAASTATLEVRRRQAPWLRALTAGLRYAAVLVIGMLIGHYIINRDAPATGPVAEAPDNPPAPWNLHPDWVAAARDLAYNSPKDTTLAGQLTLLRRSTRTPR